MNLLHLVARSGSHAPWSAAFNRASAEPPDFLVVVDPARRLVSASGSWNELFRGWWNWPAGVAGEAVAPHVDAADAWLEWWRLVDRTLTRGTTRTDHVSWQGPGGEVVNLALGLEPLRDDRKRTIAATVRGWLRAPASAVRNEKANRGGRAVLRLAPAEPAWIRVRAERGRFVIERLSASARRLWPSRPKPAVGALFPGKDASQAASALVSAMNGVRDTAVPATVSLLWLNRAAGRPQALLEATVTRTERGRLMIVLRDQTALRGHQHLHAGYARQLEAMLKHGSDWLLILDREGRITGAEHPRPTDAPAFSAGRALAEFAPPPYRAALERSLTDAWTSGRPAVLEWPAGEREEQWLRTRIVALSNERPEMAFLVAAADITAEREAARACRRLATLLEHSTDGIVGVANDGTISDWNHGAEAITGTAAAAALGRPALDFVPPANRPEERRAFEQALAGVSVPAVGSRRHGPGGRKVDVVVAIFPHREGNGAVSGVTQVIRDVSSVHSMEDQLRQAQRVVSQGMLAAMTGHEIKNYLGIALGLAHLFQEQHPQHRAQIEPVLRAVRLAGDITQQLQQIGRPEPANPKLLDLAAVVRDACDMLRRVIPRELRSEQQGTGAIPVNVDPVAFDQVLVNLILNARDATSEEHGVIVVRVGREPAGGAFLEVSDNGTGLPPSAQARLFERYFTTKPRGRGTGLGLANVRSIVQAAGGTIRYHSVNGAGTTVRIELPSAE